MIILVVIIVIIIVVIIIIRVVITQIVQSMRHGSAPKENCPWCLSLWGRLGDTPKK